MEQNAPTPVKVAILCTTYNHAPYILQSLEGFVIQKTDFPYAAIVIDDASTDKEPEVLWGFINTSLDASTIKKEETDDYIRVIARHKTNQNCIFVMIFLKYNHYQKKDKRPYYKDWETAAQYIAECEGDDYWTDPNKLQKQVDFLESHPDYGLVHANANSFFQETKKMVIAKPVENYKEKGFNDIIWRNPVITLTALYRREAMEGYTDLLRGINFGIGDLPAWLYISHRYKVHFLNETVGVYRHVSGSASHGKTYEKRKKYLDDIFQVVTFFAEKYGVDDFDKLENRYHINLFNEAFAYKRKDDAISEYNKISTKNFRIYVKRFLLLFV